MHTAPSAPRKVNASIPDVSGAVQRLQSDCPTAAGIVHVRVERIRFLETVYVSDRWSLVCGDRRERRTAHRWDVTLTTAKGQHVIRSGDVIVNEHSEGTYPIREVVPDFADADKALYWAMEYADRLAAMHQAAAKRARLRRQHQREAIPPAENRWEALYRSFHRLGVQLARVVVDAGESRTPKRWSRSARVTAEWKCRRDQISAGYGYASSKRMTEAELRVEIRAMESELDVELERPTGVPQRMP